MLDFFLIFSKSGIVIFATGVNQAVDQVVNKLIKNVILEERTERYSQDSLVLQRKLDNEFGLVFVVGYQKMLTLSYVDKFLTDIQLAFRDKFNDFDLRRLLLSSGSRRNDGKRSGSDVVTFNLVDFESEYTTIYSIATRAPAPTAEMRSFNQSAKSQKTVSSMIIKPEDKNKKEVVAAPAPVAAPAVSDMAQAPIAKLLANGVLPRNKAKDSSSSPKAKQSKQDPKNNSKGKKQRNWDLGGKDDGTLDFSKKNGADGDENSSSITKNVAGASGFDLASDYQITSKSLEFESSEEEDEGEEVEAEKPKKNATGFLGSLVKSLSYQRALTKEDLDPILNKLRDHLIAKNVASEIAVKLTASVSTKLEGQQVNTWMGLKSFVSNALEESVLRILSPNRNVNILREIQTKKNPPYVICFCGVNGVGKSTNLAKISNWLILNGVKVLVVACDTFRAGAIEQLKTHVTALKNIHEKDGKTKIDLYAKGYNKDSAAIAMEGINFARTAGFNCCLIDTAGRMQDNEPLMKELSKLIKTNEPDLTLFVGEALVGNEAVDQLKKFNTSLLDHGCRGTGGSTSSAINGIVLTKFDTIDDQVGAAVSMTYEVGQPIVFVGVGQTYKDLKQLNAKAVVRALMK